MRSFACLASRCGSFELGAPQDKRRFVYRRIAKWTIVTFLDIGRSTYHSVVTQDAFMLSCQVVLHSRTGQRAGIDFRVCKTVASFVEYPSRIYITTHLTWRPVRVLSSSIRPLYSNPCGGRHAVVMPSPPPLRRRWHQVDELIWIFGIRCCQGEKVNEQGGQLDGQPDAGLAVCENDPWLTWAPPRATQT
jgi:hypothetical protein